MKLHVSTLLAGLTRNVCGSWKPCRYSGLRAVWRYAQAARICAFLRSRLLLPRVLNQCKGGRSASDPDTAESKVKRNLRLSENEGRQIAACVVEPGDPAHTG